MGAFYHIHHVGFAVSLLPKSLACYGGKPLKLDSVNLSKPSARFAIQVILCERKGNMNSGHMSGGCLCRKCIFGLLGVYIGCRVRSQHLDVRSVSNKSNKMLV